MALYASDVLEGTLKGFEITGGILAFDRESLQNCLLMVLALPTTKNSNLVAFPKSIL